MNAALALVYIGLLFMACYLSGCVPSGDAQTAPGTLTGVVLDPSGARIPRASVHVHGNRFDSDTAANGSGVFAVTLPAGAERLS